MLSAAPSCGFLLLGLHGHCHISVVQPTIQRVVITLITRNRPGLPYETLINRLTPCKPQTCRAFLCMHRRGSCGVFFCLSVLCHNHGCEGGSAATLRRPGAWPPPPYPDGHMRNAPCITVRFVQGVYFALRRQDLNLKKLTLSRFIRAKSSENGAFYGSRPAENAGKSRVFRESDR